MNSLFPYLSVFGPPYTTLTSLDPDQNWKATRGNAFVWYLCDAVNQRAEYDWLMQRPARVPLFVVLPPADAIGPILPIIPQLSLLRARGVLPNGPLDNCDSVRMLLAQTPRDLPSVMVTYFTRRGLLRSNKSRTLVHKIFELAPTVPSICALSRRLYTSRRTLGRFFESEKLPVPSHWLQFARLLYVTVTLQANENVPVFRIATQFHYPDGFTMSNQMKRLVGCRPTDVRENLGYEWFVEDWLERESDPASRSEGELGEDEDERESA
jgi:AraC-like DNA-binding protein